MPVYSYVIVTKLCVCVFSLQGMNKAIDSELLEYSVHAGVQTTLQVWVSHTLKVSYSHIHARTKI